MPEGLKVEVLLEDTKYQDNLMKKYKLKDLVSNGSHSSRKVRSNVLVGSIENGYGYGDILDANATQQVATNIAETKINTVKQELLQIIGEMEGGASANAKSTIALTQGESYLTLTSATNSADGHIEYTLSTTGIDNAISTAVAAVVNGAPAAFDTLKEISDWITADQTGAAAILADVSNKANKVANATVNNFAGLDANGGLIDSGSKASDFATAAQGAKADTAVQDASYVHTDNNYTTAEKNKLVAISASVTDDTLFVTTIAS